MKKLVFVGASILLGLLLLSATASRRLEEKRINMLIVWAPSTAQIISQESCIPVSVFLAQGILESSWGQSRGARMFNSFFGWTAGKHWDGSTHRNGDGIARSYQTRTQSFEDHARNLTTMKRYSSCFTCNKIVDARKRSHCWFIKLEQSGYCSNAYANKLIGLEKKYNLSSYDTKSMCK